MLVVGTTPAVGYRHDSFKTYLNVWNGSSWGSPKPDPSGNNTHTSIHSTPGFAANDDAVLMAYSRIANSASSGADGYDRVFAHQWDSTSGWSTLNAGAEVSFPSSSASQTDANEPAIACRPGTPRAPALGLLDAASRTRHTHTLRMKLGSWCPERAWDDSPGRQPWETKEEQEGARRGAVIRRTGRDGFGRFTGIVFRLIFGKKPFKSCMIVGNDIVDINECRLFQADIDKSRLHPGQNPLYIPFVNIAGNIQIIVPLDEKLHNRAVLEQGHTRLVITNIDDKFFIHYATGSFIR